MNPSPKRVGVVGAGVSGVVAAAHLRAAGLEVTVFERSAVAGGVWLFDSRLPPDPSYPALVASIADNSVGNNPQLSTRIDKGKSEVETNPEYDVEILHAPPGYVYGLPKLRNWKLNNMISAHVMKDSPTMFRQL
jgi:ACS family pantothenate transporter-like MFS transporter